MTKPLSLNGLVVATVLPFAEDGSVDWRSYRRLLDYCATPDFTTAVFVNGHAGESAALDDETRRRVLRETRAAIGSKPLLSGIVALSTEESVRQAKMAEDAGADCIVVFPLNQFQAGGTATPDAPIAYVDAIAQAVNVPLSIFQYPVGSGLGYNLETLSALVRMPQVVAIKEGGDSIALYEDNWRILKQIKPGLSILPSNYDWFLPQLAIGADGILSGLGSLVPQDLNDLWLATVRQDLAAMRAINDRLYPIVRSIYGVQPRMDMHTRIKVGLQHLGIIDCARPRPPLLPVKGAICSRVIEAIDTNPTLRQVRRLHPASARGSG
jgi:4-hydroxy-tetrahydrodipicolinate synthase